MKIYCSWVQTKTTHLPTLYRTSYSVNKGREVEPCEQEHIGTNECMISNPPFWTSKFLVNITEINPLGSNSTIIQIDAHELLKPYPPEDFRVLQVEGQPTQLLVQWSCPSSWPAEILSAFPLTFSLRYRPIGSSYWST
ncbi:interleukin-11 receptor subunit alpha-like, partial [Sinocyclocheilus grahami]|uniref:interleukin-11 receptor subunit alpha-like n=1 Tax=Sinocyclocheilus grahami TaxID=75366 RepID=UPI0007ACDD38